ncbi:MAG: pyrroloquinoline quinone-dependent dehydrogenase, partial [Gammaproteobacteria bacterium]
KGPLMSTVRNLFLLALYFFAAAVAAEQWQHYGGDAGGSRFANLEQVNKENVAELQVAWQIRTGEMEKRGPVAAAGQFQVTPILTPAAAGQSLVLCTPWNKVMALDPVTGEERWSHDPKSKGFPLYNCRGVAYWEDVAAQAGSVCKHRIIAGTFDLRLMALDARSGELCPGFGSKGYFNTKPIIKAESPSLGMGDIKYFSAPVVVDDVIVIGSATFTKNKSVTGPSGAIRGYDARTGEHLWSFDPVPRDPNDPEHKNWTPESLKTTGAASAWAPLSADPENGLVFVPTSSATPDFFGGFRPGDNRYANSTVALEASTGKVVWHFQNIHHDVWDWDTPAQPIAVDIQKDGKTVPAVIQLTKQGLTFTFERTTGKPVFAIEERPVTAESDFAGEVLSPTQPFPVAPPPLAPNGITPDDAWGLTFWDEGECRELIESHNYGPVFTPPSKNGYVSITSINNWAGGAYDKNNNLLITNVSNIFWITEFIPADEYDPDTVENLGPPAPVIDGWGYAVIRRPILSPLGMPCTAPPWGKLVAIDMDTGEIRWDVALGSLEKLAPGGLPIPWGTPGAAGGAIVTASGLVFIGATSDEKFRAFDVQTGAELWEAELPTSANATPMTYEIDGKQFIVVASGGHVWQYPNVSDYVTAFALP